MKKLALLALFLSTLTFASYSPNTIITDPAGVNQAAVKAASTAPTGTDQALVVGLSPNGALPAFASTPTFNLGTLNGAATATLQSTLITNLGSPFQAGGSIGNSSFGISGTLPAYAATPTFNLGTLNGAATAANQSTMITSLSTIASNTPAVGQALMAASSPVVIASNQSSIPVTGTFFQSTQPVSAASLPLPSNAAEETGGNLATIATNTTGVATASAQATGNASLASIDAGIPAALGAATTANSMPVTIASDQIVSTSMPDSYVTGAATQTATVNNILTASSGTAATDSTGYRSASVQVVSTGTAGTFIFEGSNDNSNFQTIPVYSQLILTGTPITAAITASASQLIYTFPVTVRYIRLRIATTITGGSIQAFTRLSQAAWTPAIFQVAQGTAANLATTATISSGTVTTVSTVSAVTSSNDGIPGIIADVASAAITTTTTTAAFTPTFGSSYIIDIPVTVVSGTTPTYVVAVQESSDTGTNWQTVYTFPTITATGFYISPQLFFKGNRVRYVQTLTGTTPSFTRAINRLQISGGSAAPVNNNATFASASVSVATTLTAPQNAIGFILQNLNSNTTNLRYAIGATASATNGMQLEPGRDTGEIHSGQNISICPESGSITYSLQWVQQ